MNKRPARILLAALIVMLLTSSGALMMAVGRDSPDTRAPSADPALDSVTTSPYGKMMFNNSLVDATFVAKLFNYGTIGDPSVTVNISVNETGSAAVLFSDSKTVAVNPGPETQVTFSVWSKTFSTETTYWVTVNITGWTTNSDNTNDQLFVPFIIKNLHDIGPSGFENINYGAFFHPTESVDLTFTIHNYGTYDETSGIWVNCTIYNLSSPINPKPILYTKNVTAFSSMDPLFGQFDNFVMYTPTWVTPSQYTKCRVEVRTFFPQDQVHGNNMSFWDVEVTNRFDASVAGLSIQPPGPYAPGSNVTINATIENVGNMVMTDVNITCDITIDGAPVYSSYVIIASLPDPWTDAGMGMYIQEVQFLPIWQVAGINGTAVINISIVSAEDQKGGNDHQEASYPVYAQRRNLAVSGLSVTPDPLTAPGALTFNMTIKNFEDDLGGFIMNTSVYDSSWSLVAFENTTISQVIPGSGGTGYHDYVWMVDESVPDGDYNCISTIYLVGDINKDNNDRTQGFTIDYLHDLAIINTTSINDTQVINIDNKAGEFKNFGIIVKNNGPVSEDYSVNATVLGSDHSVLMEYDQPDKTIPAGGTQYVNFSHEFSPGTYNVVYDIIFAGDEAPEDNELNISFEITSLKAPLPVITSPVEGQEVALNSWVYLNGSGSKSISDGGNITSYEWTGSWTGSVLSTKAQDHIEITELGDLSVTLTVTDNFDQSASATISFTSVEALTGVFTYYGMTIEYSYRSGSNITQTGENKTASGSLPLEYEALDLFYEGGISTDGDGKLYWVNVTLDPTFANQSKLGLVESDTLTIFTLDDTTWGLPAESHGFHSGRSWFYVGSVESTSVNYVMGLFGRKIVDETALLSGTVARFNTTELIENATVTLFSGGEVVNSTSTDDKGVFGMTAPLGYYELRVSHPDYLDKATGRVVLGADGLELIIELMPVEKGMVYGKVTDVRTRVALQDVLVELIATGATDATASASTDAGGEYTIDSIDNGGYYLRFSLDSYITEETDPFEISEMKKSISYDKELTRLNNKPVLSDGGFSPSKGKDTDKYSFWVTYTDQDNNPPNALGVEVMVGDRKVTLIPEEGSTDFTSGVKYSVEGIKLDEGEYKVIFLATDVDGAPAFSLNLDDKLVVTEDTSAAQMTTLLIIATIVLIVIVILVIGIVFLLFRRKAQKDQENLEQITPDVDTKVSELMCTGCGSVLPEGTVKCPKCGRDLKKVEEQHSKEFKCPTCGAANPVGTTKCTACEKDFTAKVTDTTRMADDKAEAETIVAEGDAAEAEAAWKEPIEGDEAAPGAQEDMAEEGVTSETLDSLESEEISDADFDDGLTFEGFDEL